MKLLRATFLSIRGLPDATWSFGDAEHGATHDLVVVTGPPSSGKSRFLAALLAAKEVIAPYVSIGGGAGARWLAPGAPSAKIALAFQLDEAEQRRTGLGPIAEAEALFTEERCRHDADEPLITLLEDYGHDSRHGKFDYLPDNRAIAPPGVMHGLSMMEQRTLRLGRDARKYSFIPRLLFAFTWEPAFAGARDRFAAGLEALSPTLRYLGPNQADPGACFASRGGARVSLGDLSSSEGHAVLAAASAALLSWDRSVVLVDRPEISASERTVAGFVDALRGFGKGMQLIVASDSPALLASVDPRRVITLS